MAEKRQPCDVFKRFAGLSIEQTSIRPQYNAQSFRTVGAWKSKNCCVFIVTFNLYYVYHTGKLETPPLAPVNVLR